MKNKLPFGFDVSLLVPLAEHTATLLGEPFGALTKETTRTGSEEHYRDSTAWKDARGHVVRLHYEYTRQYFEAGDHEFSARIEGLPGGVTIAFLVSSAVLMEYEVIGPEDAARAAIRAWVCAMIERASDWKMATGGKWGVPPEWEPRARAFLAGVVRARFEVADRMCAFEQEGEKARFGVRFDSYLTPSGSMSISLIGPLPRESRYAEVVYFTGFDQPRARMPAPDMGAFVAHVFPANTWRCRETPGPEGLLFRVQHDEGLGPAAFVLWRPQGTIDALFVGSEHEVRAGIDRLGEWLNSLRWRQSTPWRTSFW